MRRGLAAWALWLGATAATAATVESVEVTHTDPRYHVDMRVQVGVSAAQAFAVMTDFANLPDVNDNLVLSQPLPDDRLRTEVAMCVAFFCKHVRQLQIVTTEADRRLTMRVLPEESDLRFGRAEWRFEPLGPDAARIHFSAELEPDFWVPPVVGPWLIGRKLEAQAVETSRGIEREAHERAE